MDPDGTAQAVVITLAGDEPGLRRGLLLQEAVQVLQEGGLRQLLRNFLLQGAQLKLALHEALALCVKNAHFSGSFPMSRRGAVFFL